MRIRYTSPPHWPPIKLGRFAETIRVDNSQGCALALVGLPDDTGIKLNGGRIGAAQGPVAFRAALASFGGVWDGLYRQALSAKVFDAGDVEPVAGDDETALLETHARVESVVSELHRAGLLPVCIGGGHDLSLPSITALAKHVGGPIGGINFDAHLDVRQRVGSGMAFRRLIEDRHLDARRFAEVGLGRFANDEDDFLWLTKQGGTLVLADSILHAEMPLRDWMDVAFAAGSGFVSIDLDGIDAASAPGVSAVNPCGLQVSHAVALAEAAGANPRVQHFDLMELSPPHDVAARTARVAALLFLSFVAGFGARPQ